MLTRRNFVGLAAASLASQALRAQQPDAPAKPSGVSDVQFSVMIWALKKLGSFEGILNQVSQAGYHHVELTGEYKQWSDEEYKHMLGIMEGLKITVDAISGVNPGFGEPATQDAFLASLKSLVPHAERLQTKQIILLSTKVNDKAAPGAQHAASIEALKRAGDILGHAGLNAVIEPIDRLENPTIYLDGVTEAFEIVRAVGNPNIKVLYDIYHEQRQFGNLIEKFEKNIDQVGLIHVADVPGRHQPGTGEIDYLNIYHRLVQLKYAGVIAMEFYPTGDEPFEVLQHARDQARAILA